MESRVMIGWTMFFIFIVCNVNAIDKIVWLQPSTPPPVIDMFAFPDGKFCSEIDLIDKEGPTWGNIHIGTSSLEELEAAVYSLSNLYETQGLRQDRVSYGIWDARRAGQLQIPVQITACILDDTVWLLDVVTTRVEPPINVVDLIAEYGLPTTVTWTDASTDRVVFWFEAGIAATVNAYELEGVSEYGKVYTIIYFPFQSNEGYETRWPYNVTRTTPSIDIDVVHSPPVPTEQNPFDFEAMLAARPTQTPTLRNKCQR
jgi:hypothetical protein